MDCFETTHEMGHEQVVWCQHRPTGLRAIIAIHDTTLGPSLGGCRFYDYPSEREALVDVLRLSRGMTYKAAVAGLDLGGGKAVILGRREMRTEALFRAFGRFIESLGGRYITAEDMNTGEREMEWIHRETRHVTGLSPTIGGGGDPSPVTAWGCYHGIRACLARVYGDPDPAGRRVAIQGVGSVGWSLAEHLHAAGARLSFTDVDEQRVARAVEAFGGVALEGDDFYAADVDVLAPCAIGAVVNPKTLPRIQAPILAGAANNILEEEPRDAHDLARRGILYAPDYVINAGGIISVYCERKGWPREKAMDDAARIYDTVSRVFAWADEEDLTPAEAAGRIAEERLAANASIHHLHLPR